MSLAETCTHPACLVFGREEVGGARFPMVWCRVCGAICIDAGKYEARCWSLPRPDYRDPESEA